MLENRNAAMPYSDFRAVSAYQPRADATKKRAPQRVLVFLLGLGGEADRQSKIGLVMRFLTAGKFGRSLFFNKG